MDQERLFRRRCIRTRIVNTTYEKATPPQYVAYPSQTIPLLQVYFQPLESSTVSACVRPQHFHARGASWTVHCDEPIRVCIGQPKSLLDGPSTFSLPRTGDHIENEVAALAQIIPDSLNSPPQTGRGRQIVQGVEGAGNEIDPLRQMEVL